MYGQRRGQCYRCGKFGHFARECFAPRESSSPFVGGNTMAAPATPAGPPKPDPGKTKRWNVPESDPQVQVRSDDEFRILLKLMWEKMPKLVLMLFARFGKQRNLPDCNADSSFLDGIKLSGDMQDLVELDFQLGRRAEAHFYSPDGRKRKEFIIDPLDETIEPSYRDHKVTLEDLQLFAGDVDAGSFKHGWWHANGSRQGIPGTLHRLAGISGRDGKLIGVVMRVGRTVPGIVERMLPVEFQCSDKSVLLVGPPNSGKTTVLREFARLLSDREDRVVVVVDKTSEIAGASDAPHGAIGSSTRWMPVDDPRNQHAFMRKAVENLSPDTVIVDEISTESDCDSAKTISQRGVQLVATCHGKSMAELVNDKDRSTLLGGVTSVTLSKVEVDKRVSEGGSSSKQVQMRKYEPLFGTVIEIHKRDLWYIHPKPKEAVDAYVRREPVLALRATPGRMEQVVAHPDEEGFRYEPELPASAGAGPKKPTVTMSAKGSEVKATRRAMASVAPPTVPTPARNDGGATYGGAPTAAPPPWAETLSAPNLPEAFGGTWRN